jgi:hypothetical protein
MLMMMMKLSRDSVVAHMPVLLMTRSARRSGSLRSLHRFSRSACRPVGPVAHVADVLRWKRLCGRPVEEDEHVPVVELAHLNITGGRTSTLGV